MRGDEKEERDGDAKTETGRVVGLMFDTQAKAEVLRVEVGEEVEALEGTGEQSICICMMDIDRLALAWNRSCYSGCVGRVIPMFAEVQMKGACAYPAGV